MKELIESNEDAGQTEKTGSSLIKKRKLDLKVSKRLVHDLEVCHIVSWLCVESVNKRRL